MKIDDETVMAAVSAYDDAAYPAPGEGGCSFFGMQAALEAAFARLNEVPRIPYSELFHEDGRRRED